MDSYYNQPSEVYGFFELGSEISNEVKDNHETSELAALVVNFHHPTSIQDSVIKVVQTNVSSTLDLPTLPDDILAPVLNQIDVTHVRDDVGFKKISNNNRKEFKCNPCGENFFSVSKLRSHRYKVHNEKQHMCEICSKSFGLSADLKVHLRTHSGQKPFPCEFCPKRFTTSSNLNDHMKTHTGEKNWKCIDCPKAYARSSDLKVHIKSVHSNTKPHVCTVCSKAFTIHRVLLEHMRIHEDTKPFECKMCQKGFTLKSHLKMHELEHTGGVRYSCEECGSCFVKAIEYKRHMMQVHYRNRPFKCPKCPSR